MEAPVLTIRNLGPVAQADLELGDLTLLVGPQASGKSLALQTLKAAVDMDAVVETLKRHGYQWAESERPGPLAELVYGEGMGGVIGDDTALTYMGAPWSLGQAGHESWHKKRRRAARVFYVPAQRVLTIQDGWPRPFTSFDIGAPYVVKRFSEDLRVFLENLQGEPLFPKRNQLKADLKTAFDGSIFHGAQVAVDRSRLRKRIVLRPSGARGDTEGLAADALPFLSWSAGQREFIPLMLGLYWLMPGRATSRRKPLEIAVIEEPEMGLHPQATSAVVLALLELVRRGYRVVVSTHSPHVLELAWALRWLQGSPHFITAFHELFGTGGTSPGLDAIANAARHASIRAHAFLHGRDGAGVHTKDISSLDASDEDPDVAGWGGLTDLADRAGEVVAKWS